MRDFFVARVEILPALALAHLVVGQRGDAVARQVRGQNVFARLAVGTMARRHHHRRDAPAAGGRQVQIRRHHEPRQTFERDLLDAKAVALERAGNLRIQRTALVRQPAHGAQHLLANLGAALLRRLASGNRGDGLRTLLQHGEGALIQLPDHLIAGVVIGRAQRRREHQR